MVFAIIALLFVVWFTGARALGASLELRTDSNNFVRVKSFKKEENYDFRKVNCAGSLKAKWSPCEREDIESGK